MKYDTEQRTVRMIKRQSVFKKKTVLEIGCGRGRISSLLADDTKQYIGIDPDNNAIREAKASFGNVDFMTGSGEALAFGDSFFDLVLFTLSLHHQNSGAALKEAHRVLKDNGNLIVVEPSVKGEFQQFFHLFDDETRAIENAFCGILKSAFALEAQDTFDATVRFEDKIDLFQYDFDREQKAAGDQDRIMNKLEQLQPGASCLSPIILKDTLDIYRLAKIRE